LDLFKLQKEVGVLTQLALISDIHGNSEALQAVLSQEVEAPAGAFSLYGKVLKIKNILQLKIMVKCL
jgi:hypothetical protein